MNRHFLFGLASGFPHPGRVGNSENNFAVLQAQAIQINVPACICSGNNFEVAFKLKRYNHNNKSSITSNNIANCIHGNVLE